MDTYELFHKLSSGAKYKQKAIPTKTEPSPLSTATSGDNVHLLTDALDFFGDSASASHTDPEHLGGAPLHLGKRKRVQEEEEEDQEGGAGYGSGGSDLEDLEQEVPSEKEEEGVAMFSGHTPMSSGRTREKRKKKKKLTKETKELLRRQEANAFRNSCRIYVTGPDVPDAVGSFQQLFSSYTVPSCIARNMASVGYLEPTPIQMQAIPLLLQGREVLACAPTGSGKTAAFIVPILANLKEPKKVGFRAVVVSPTRELAQQTYREFVRLSAGSGFRVHVLTKAKATANTFGAQSSQRFDILVTTPNRLVHMLCKEPPAIHLHNVEWLILDESDKLFEDGHTGFKDQVAQIYRSCDHPDVKRALFSATLASGVEEFCHAFLDNPVRITIGLPNSAAEMVKQELLFVGQESGKLIAIRDIIHKGFTPPMLIFVQSIERAKDLFQELIYGGLNVDVIHSERTQAQRDNIVKCFRAGKIWVLICTDVMGRGMDFKGVNLVLNYDFPPTAISYIHRIGRTGRAGRQGKALTFFTEDDTINLRSIANVMQNSGCEIPKWMLKLKKPSKNTRKKLSKTPLVREQVKTVSKYDLQRSTKRKQMIAGSKRRAKIDK